jgi:hypothetical protein
MKRTKRAENVLFVDQMGNEMHKNCLKRVNGCPGGASLAHGELRSPVRAGDDIIDMGRG